MSLKVEKVRRDPARGLHHERKPDRFTRTFGPPRKYWRSFEGTICHLEGVTSAGEKTRLSEYQLNLFAVKDGSFAFDVQPINASGTSPYVNFEGWHELRQFLSSLNLSNDLIAQVEGLCATLKPGHAFHQRMFLPPCVEEGLKILHGEAKLCA